jgi:hypothetical protein
MAPTLGRTITLIAFPLPAEYKTRTAKVPEECLPISYREEVVRPWPAFTGRRAVDAIIFRRFA